MLRVLFRERKVRDGDRLGRHGQAAGSVRREDRVVYICYRAGYRVGRETWR